MNKPAESADKDTETTSAPLLAHLGELRRRLTYCIVVLLGASVAAYPAAPSIYSFLVRPLAAALHGADRRMIYTGLTEAFMTYMKLAFFAGAFVSMPVILYQIWSFIAPGLYRREKNAFLPFLVATPVLFFVGAGFVYSIVMPLAWRFFAGFESLGGTGGLPIQLEARVSEYLSLIMQMMMAFGLCFQLPVLMTLLGRAGFLTSRQVGEKRRHAVIAALVIAALLTPPDVLSQLTLAIPLMGLYEISFWLLKWGERAKKP